MPSRVMIGEPLIIHRLTNSKEATVTFVLIDHREPVSVVGSFNDWAPGAHPLVAGADGTRSVTVVLPLESEVYFRYLGIDGRWFDDPDADEVTHDGSILRLTMAHVSADNAEPPADSSEVVAEGAPSLTTGLDPVQAESFGIDPEAVAEAD